MSRFQIEDAVRRGNKARVSLSGPAGSGKTFTALAIAVELAKGGDILVIDTERGSASLYADQYVFRTLRWEPPYDPRELAQEVVANCSRFEVIVIDSLSHFWKGEGGTLAIVDEVASKQRGPDNKFAAWNTGTKAQDEMVNAVLTSPCHVIATMRSKMAYVQEKVMKDGRETTQIRRLGMEPVQRDDLEYEFTVTADLDKEHHLTIEKTRCSALAGAVYDAGTADRMGRALKEWLDGAEVEPPPAPVPPRHQPPRPTRPSPFVKAVLDAAEKAKCPADILAGFIQEVTGQPDPAGVLRDHAPAITKLIGQWHDAATSPPSPPQEPKAAPEAKETTKPRLCPGGCGWAPDACRCPTDSEPF